MLLEGDLRKLCMVRPEQTLFPFTNSLAVNTMANWVKMQAGVFSESPTSGSDDNLGTLSPLCQERLPSSAHER